MARLVKLSVTDSITKTQYPAIASKININTWRLEIGSGQVYEMTGHLQINPV
jgi:hypothetical protein